MSDRECAYCAAHGGSGDRCPVGGQVDAGELPVEGLTWEQRALQAEAAYANARDERDYLEDALAHNRAAARDEEKAFYEFRKTTSSERERDLLARLASLEERHTESHRRLCGKLIGATNRLRAVETRLESVTAKGERDRVWGEALRKLVQRLQGEAEGGE